MIRKVNIPVPKRLAWYILAAHVTVMFDGIHDSESYPSHKRLAPVLGTSVYKY